ncbi:MAG: ArnT family glycosyltransferase [Halobacteriales archaeon]
MSRPSPLDSLARTRRPPSAVVAAVAVALLVGVATVLTGSEVIPHLSANHDEAVYLQQAELLLAGQLELTAGALADAVRPWFYVADGGRLYPKYAPYPAGLYALAMATVGEARVALGAVAAANVLLVYGLGASTFDRRIGLLAAGAFSLAPMTILASAAFLPYAPTTTLALLFAWSYLRTYRTGRYRPAAIAGVAIGLAFFARPYTAVLVGAPFVGHAAWRVARSWLGRRPLDRAVTTNAVTAALGLGFVALSLAYNARMTGDPLVFPYQAFAPRDGPGFGSRAILGHAVEYTPAMGVRSSLWNLWYLITRWGPLGVLGVALASLGVVAAALEVRQRGLDRQAVGRGLLLGVVATTILGNVAFWGNHNLLGTPWDPTDGLVSLFGPFYHLDVLWPLAIFAAAGLAATIQWGLARTEVDPEPVWADPRRRRTVVAVVLVAAVLAGGVTAVLLAGPLERHDGYTERYASVYEPVEAADLEGAVVELPTPYGPWLNHPFQSLRNQPGLDGPVVFAQAGGAARTFELRSAYPDRDLHRLTYRGSWDAAAPEPVDARIERLRIGRGERLRGRAAVGIPDRVEHYTVRLEASGERAVVESVAPSGDEAVVEWTVTPEAVALEDRPNRSLELADHDRVDLFVRLVEPGGATLTYHQSVDVRSTGDTVEVVWPPERRVCRLVDRCGSEGTYLPDRPDVHIAGVSFEVSLDEDRP